MSDNSKLSRKIENKADHYQSVHQSNEQGDFSFSQTKSKQGDSKQISKISLSSLQKESQSESKKSFKIEIKKKRNQESKHQVSQQEKQESDENSSLGSPLSSQQEDTEIIDMIHKEFESFSINILKTSQNESDDQQSQKITRQNVNNYFGNWLLKNYDQNTIQNFQETHKKYYNESYFHVEARYQILATIKIIIKNYSESKQLQKLSIKDDKYTTVLKGLNINQASEVQELGKDIGNIIEDQKQTLLQITQKYFKSNKFVVFHRFLALDFIQTLTKSIKKCRKKTIEKKTKIVHENHLKKQQFKSSNNLRSEKNLKSEQPIYKKQQTSSYKYQSERQSKQHQKIKQPSHQQQRYEQEQSSLSNINSFLNSRQQLVAQRHIYEAFSKWLIKTYNPRNLSLFKETCSKYFSSNYFHVNPRRQILSAVQKIVDFYQTIKKYEGMKLDDLRVPKEISQAIPKTNTIKMGSKIGESIEKQAVQLKNTINMYYGSNYFHVGPRYQLLSFMNLVINQITQQSVNQENSYQQQIQQFDISNYSTSFPISRISYGFS